MSNIEEQLKLPLNTRLHVVFKMLPYFLLIYAPSIGLMSHYIFHQHNWEMFWEIELSYPILMSIFAFYTTTLTKEKVERLFHLLDKIQWNTVLLFLSFNFLLVLGLIAYAVCANFHRFLQHPVPFGEIILFEACLAAGIYYLTKYMNRKDLWFFHLKKKEL